MTARDELAALLAEADIHSGPARGRMADWMYVNARAVLALIDATRDPETVARRFHEAYERLAPAVGYETRKESAVPWSEVPQTNRDLMIATVATVVGDAVAPFLKEDS